MDSRRALLVDAFTAEPFAGTVAGVVPDAAGLSEAQMRAIAGELAVGETAFLLPSGSADRRVRVFAPSREVDRCGHAIVASYAHLSAAGVVEEGVETLETNVGVVDVETTADGLVWLTQPQPAVREVDLPLDRVGAALGVRTAALEDVSGQLPLAVASTGLPVLVVGVDFLEHLGRARPDADAIERLVGEVDAAGLYAFTFDTLDGDSTLHGRFFAAGDGVRTEPGDGVHEASGDGRANGACGAYLRHVGAFDPLPERLRFEYGHFVDRPGVVCVRVGERIRVGGRGVVSFDGMVRVPSVDDDEIIEA